MGKAHRDHTGNRTTLNTNEGKIMALLSRDKIGKIPETAPGWKLTGVSIRKKFTFENFTVAMGFVTSVALLAERSNHHPDIDIRWNTVTLTLSTHSEGGLTAKDAALAVQINSLPVN